MVWFTSDRHFGHSNIIKFCNRPYTNSQEMDEDLIAKHNSVVSPDDDVYDLGDFAFGRGVEYDYALYCLTRLNGHKHFIKGNHDKILSEIYRKQKNLFSSYRDGYVEVTIEAQPIVLCHYAMREWHHSLSGTWHLYGHTHNKLMGFGKSFDVGVDAQNFYPISFEQVKAKMDRIPIGKHAMFDNFTR